MSTKICTHLFFCLFTGIIAVSFSCNNVTRISEEAREVKTPVTTVKVSSGSLISTVDLPAATKFMNKNIIRATTSGTIDKVLIRQGDFVAAGQLLFTIRTREAMALNNIAQDSILSFKGLINIISPEAGVISSISYQKGDYVQEGDEMSVVSILNSLVFILEVPFEYEKYAEKNRKCQIFLPDGSKREGTITGKLAEMDMKSQTVSYVVKPLPSEKLPENLIAVVSLVKSSNNNAQVLPKGAVLGSETQTEFWVMKLLNDSTAIKVFVRKGYEGNSEIEITEPYFLESDRIVLTGNYGMPDTARIEIIKE